mgnify:CR=1 FL=1
MGSWSIATSFFYVQTRIFFNMLYCKPFICAMNMVGSKKSTLYGIFVVSIQIPCEHFPYFQGRVGDRDIENILWTSFTNETYSSLWETILERANFRTIVYSFCLFACTMYLSTLPRFEDLVMVRKGWKAQHSQICLKHM